MDRIRLIASDMDATLLDGHSQLPPDFLHLVQELAGQDILFAAASGRPLYKLEEMFAPVLEQTLLVATMAALCAGVAKTCSSPAWSRRSGTG